MQQAPPQYSPDGLFWWDGTRWLPRALPPQMPPPMAYAPPPPPMPPTYQSSLPRIPGVSARWYEKPSPGLRVVLIVFLALEVLASGLLSFAFIIAAIAGGQELFGVGLGLFVLLTFSVSGIALVTVLTRTAWSLWLAFGAGILMSWWVVGAVIGIPVVVCALRLELGSYQRSGPS